jgi:integrase-like protein
MSELLNRARRRRSPATMPEFHAGGPPGNKGLRYSADPPKVKEIIAVMRAAGDSPHGRRLRSHRDPVASRSAHPRGARAHRGRPRSPAWRAARPARQGRTPTRGRHGHVGLGRTGALARATTHAADRPLFCMINGPTRGRRWSSAGARAHLANTARGAGVRRRSAPHQLRHDHAVEMAREGVPLIVIQRHLGHSNLGITSIYPHGIDNAEIIDTVHSCHAPVVPVSASLRL